MSAVKKTFVVGAMVAAVAGGLWLLGARAQERGTISYRASAPPSAREAGTHQLREARSAAALAEENKEALKSGSYTGNLAQAIMLKFLSAREQGITLDEEAVRELYADAVASVEAPSPDYYTIDDFIITTDTSTSSHAAYRREVEDILENAYYEGLGLENIVYFKTLHENADQTQKEQAARALQRAAQTYGTIARALLLTPVPADLSGRHLEMVNAYLDLETGVGILAGSIFDPLRAFAGVEYYEKALDTLIAISAL